MGHPAVEEQASTYQESSNPPPFVVRRQSSFPTQHHTRLDLRSDARNCVNAVSNPAKIFS